MPDFINAVQTQDQYTAALELAPAPWTKQITFSVLAAVSGGVADPVLVTCAKYPALADGTPNYGQEPQWEPFEREFVGNTIGATITDWCGGIKFRSKIAGSPAVIGAERDFQTDIIVNSGNVSAAGISPSGSTTPGGVSSVITGIIPAAGTTPTAGTGFTYTHPSSGVYVFTFTTPFPAAPDVQLTSGPAAVDIGTFVTIAALSASGFTVNAWRAAASALTDSGFSFVAQPVV